MLLVTARVSSLKDVSASSLALHAQHFAIVSEKNVVPKFPNRISWTLYKTC